MREETARQCVPPSFESVAIPPPKGWSSSGQDSAEIHVRIEPRETRIYAIPHAAGASENESQGNILVFVCSCIAFSSVKNPVAYEYI